ncbi:hypothetical protein CW304_07665 [Bacillus sp. UFRGS-B20]|nr:hypothetical protein CW304_07665 [Bacillus sp. UFRGS-B20]
MPNNPLKISYTITLPIHKATRINLIYYTFFRPIVFPLCYHSSFFFSFLAQTFSLMNDNRFSQLKIRAYNFCSFSKKHMEKHNNLQ